MYSQQWHRDANSQQLEDTLSLDPFKDGFGPQQLTWERYAKPWFDECSFHSAGTNSIQTNQDYTLVENDRGAVTFTIDNPPEQLAIDFGGFLSDSYGYVVVLGDRGEPAYVHSKMRGAQLRTSQDTRGSWHFADTDNHLWLIYDYGRFTLGTGSVPGKGQVLLSATDSMPMPGSAAQVGFGAWKNSDGRVSTVKKVQMWHLRKQLPVRGPYAQRMMSYPIGN